MADIHLLGVAMDCGKARQGCRMGPAAYRVAHLGETLSDLGHHVTDHGDLDPDPVASMPPEMPDRVFRPGEVAGWTSALTRRATELAGQGVPVFLGGDHALSMGTVAGVAAASAATGRAQFVLWLDAHADYHSAVSTQSGNLHGTSLAYAAGRDGFPGFPAPSAPIPEENIALIGLRSVDPSEKQALQAGQAHYHDMREIDETGIAAPLRAFLDTVAAAEGALHVSLDVDFLDPDIAPAVGTTVPGGATYREAHLVMELLSDSGLVTSLDLVELNPFLDERGRTAQVMVDLTASLFGRRIFDRPTRALG